jgi:hypothetical protein
MGIKDGTDDMFRGLTYASTQVLSPRRSVITDMIMVQFISMIITFTLILFLKGGDLPTSSVSVFLVGIMIAFLGLGNVYGRITK